ncbi:hypothetical protein AHF37_06708 [Paragonimus kellicotti]|nr:hypothetical protein AHF37_06708 [Paragonimus kellicotti]
MLLWLIGCHQMAKNVLYFEIKTVHLALVLLSSLSVCSWVLLKFSPELKHSAFFYFFKHHTCYDLLPSSAKLVILDTELRIKKAFYALVFNNVRSAILWDSSRQTFVGILTITDFIKVLVNNFEPKLCRMGGFETETISEWRSLDPKTAHHPLVYTSPESSLLEAASLLIKHRFHRLPIIDPVFGNPLHILTHKRILKYLYLNVS